MVAISDYTLVDAEWKMQILDRALDAGDKGILESHSTDAAIIKEFMIEYSDEEMLRYRKHLHDESWREIELARQAHRSAMMLAMYSVFELSVLKLTAKYLQKSTSEMRLRDIAGQGYEKFIIVADRIGGRRRHNAELWSEIAAIREIRNLFAHNGGIAEEADKQTKIKKALDLLEIYEVVKSGDQDELVIELDVRSVKLIGAKLVMVIRSAYWTLFDEVQVAHP